MDYGGNYVVIIKMFFFLVIFFYLMGEDRVSGGLLGVIGFGKRFSFFFE